MCVCEFSSGRVNTNWGAFTAIAASLGRCDARDVHRRDTVMDERKMHFGMHE